MPLLRGSGTRGLGRRTKPLLRGSGTRGLGRQTMPLLVGARPCQGTHSLDAAMVRPVQTKRIDQCIAMMRPVQTSAIKYSAAINHTGSTRKHIMKQIIEQTGTVARARNPIKTQTLMMQPIEAGTIERARKPMKTWDAKQVIKRVLKQAQVTKQVQKHVCFSDPAHPHRRRPRPKWCGDGARLEQTVHRTRRNSETHNTAGRTATLTVRPTHASLARLAM